MSVFYSLKSWKRTLILNVAVLGVWLNRTEPQFFSPVDYGFLALIE